MAIEGIIAQIDYERRDKELKVKEVLRSHKQKYKTIEEQHQKAELSYKAEIDHLKNKLLDNLVKHRKACSSDHALAVRKKEIRHFCKQLDQASSKRAELQTLSMSTPSCSHMETRPARPRPARRGLYSSCHSHRHNGGTSYSELAACVALRRSSNGRRREDLVTVDGIRQTIAIVSMGVVTTMDPEAQQGKAMLLPGVGPRKKHYFCGSCAAFTNIVITFPIQKVLFRQQLFGVRASEAVTQLQRDGLRNLYRGLLPPLLQKTTTVAIMFGMYEDFSRLLARHAGGPELLTRSLAAVLAGTAEAAFTPFECVQTLLQDPRHHHRFHNTFHTSRTLLQDHGVRECYRGLVPILLRNGPSNALFFALRGPIKQQLPVAQSPGAHMVNDFICGGLLGAMLSFMFYPLNVVKARMQSRVGGAFQPSRAVLLTIWRERDGKVTHLFRGAHLNYHRSILSWGIINATYELLLKFM
ncbi:hypothetical protein AAFF_G00180210 [Aldrovandia affinis]|uniref:Solute carrier family 25 member 51 n=1 Tax=Aldrovandia affinis TaxID=143900 RepID=A0AAD7SYC2_9TELE|nr:hypothetical protein AAFF_G00180210 [Aldrovandia affinis]